MSRLPDLIRDGDASRVVEREAGIPGDLPEVPVGIREVAGAPAPEGVGGRLDDPRPALPGGLKSTIYIRGLPNVVRDGDAPEARALRRNSGIRRQIFPAPERKTDPAELEERYIVATRGRATPPERLIKRDRLWQIPDPQRYQN